MADARNLLDAFHNKERQAFDALIEIYGDDSNEVLNALHSLAARLAMATGVSPEDFSSGMKHHWDHLANAFNEHVATKRH